MGHEEDKHVRVHRPHAGLEPDLLFQGRGDGADRSPLTKYGRGMQACGLVDERFDPRFQLPFPGAESRGRCSL